MKRAVWKNLIAWATAIAVLIVAWVALYFSVGNDLLVPSFSESMQRLGALLGSESFWTAFFATLGRVIPAFLLSFIFAAIFAVISYLLPTFSAFFAPFVSVLRSMPVLAVLLILLVWSGAGKAPVVVAFLSLFPTLYAGFSAALAGVDGELIEMSRVFKVPLFKRVVRLYLPSAAPHALKESGAALAFSLKLVVSAEVLAMTARSLGGLMQEAKLYLDMPLLFALVCVTFALGLVLEWIGEFLARLVERRVK